MSVRNFMFHMVSNRGVPSSKRFITFLAFILMATGFIGNMFFGLKIEEFIYSSMQWIVIGGLGFTASELFAHKKIQRDEGYGGGGGGFGGMGAGPGGMTGGSASMEPCAMGHTGASGSKCDVCGQMIP